MTILWIIIAVLLAIAGVVQLTGATVGVGLICIGCLFGIFARISQAHKK